MSPESESPESESPESESPETSAQSTEGVDATTNEYLSDDRAPTASETLLDEVPQPAPRRAGRRRTTPYLLIAPAILYLAMFFAYPMFEAVGLAVRDDEAKLPLVESPVDGGKVADLDKGTLVVILEQQGVPVAEGDTAEFVPEYWYEVSADDLTGWIPESRLRVKEENAEGVPTVGTIRPRLGEGASDTTELYESAFPDALAVGQLAERTEVMVVDSATLEVWYQVQAESANDIVGWAPSRTIDVYGDGENGRIQTGTVGEFTTEYFSEMYHDAKFAPALRTTLLLMVLILPAQFVLAMIMALVINSRLRFGSGFLYVFTLPMGMSDLAAGILFFSIFSGGGYLNSLLQGLGLIDEPANFLTADTRHWIIFAIVVAELWRATSIVMVILVSGLQAIPSETLEAAELFGASYWQRIRYVILPLLRPSIQVALILRTILAFQVFAVVVALSGGGIVTVLANESYRQYYDLRNNNVAAAYALFILALSMVSAFLYLRSVRTESEVRPS